jgi:hypothetical protein
MDRDRVAHCRYNTELLTLWVEPPAHAAVARWLGTFLISGRTSPRSFFGQERQYDLQSYTARKYDRLATEARSQIRASGIATMVAESPMVTLALKASIVLLPHDRSNGYRLER